MSTGFVASDLLRATRVRSYSRLFIAIWREAVKRGIRNNGIRNNFMRMRASELHMLDDRQLGNSKQSEAKPRATTETS